MAKRRIATEAIPCGELLEGDVIMVGEGHRAKVVSLGHVSHTVTQEIPVRVVQYELLDGEWAGAQAHAPYLGSDEVEIEEREDTRSRWQRIKSFFT